MIPGDFDLTGLVPPRPRVTPVSRPFWEALRDHRLVIQQCVACGRWVHYPRVRCPGCGAADLEFREVEAAATVHTFTIARQPTARYFRAEVPQVIAIVELANGVRLTTTLVTDDPDGVAVGTAVVPVFDDGDDGITLLRYRPV